MKRCQKECPKIQILTVEGLLAGKERLDAEKYGTRDWNEKF